LRDRFLEDSKTIKDALGKFMKVSRMDKKLMQIEIKDRWEEIAGSLIARHTTSLSLFGSKLTIQLDSAPLKQEISYHKKALLDKINKGLGQVAITELHIQ